MMLFVRHGDVKPQRRGTLESFDVDVSLKKFGALSENKRTARFLFCGSCAFF